MFSISQIRSRLRVVRPNMFFATIQLPPKIASFINTKNAALLGGSAYIGGAKQAWLDSINLDASAGMNNTFAFRCESTELPGRTIATTEDISYGPVTKHSYDMVYNDLNMTIIASEDMRERAIFELWMEQAVQNTSQSGGSLGGRGGLVGYYEDYATGIVRIYQVNDAGEQLAKYTLAAAYPIQVSAMNLNWEELNTYQRFTVTMTYRYHIVDFEKKFL